MLGMNWCYISWVSRRFNSGPDLWRLVLDLGGQSKVGMANYNFCICKGLGHWEQAVQNDCFLGTTIWCRSLCKVCVLALAPSHGHKASDLRIWGRSPAHTQTTVGLIHIFVAHPLIWNPVPSTLFPSVHHPSTLHHAVRNPFQFYFDILTFKNGISTAKSLFNKCCSMVLFATI